MVLIEDCYFEYGVLQGTRISRDKRVLCKKQKAYACTTYAVQSNTLDFFGYASQPSHDITKANPVINRIHSNDGDLRGETNCSFGMMDG